MIGGLLRRARKAYWRDPYAPKPEPLQTLPELRARAERALADVADIKAAFEVNTMESR